MSAAVARRLVLAAPMLLMLPRFASAEVITLWCEVPWRHSGRVLHRPVVLDGGARLVRDGSMAWRDGEVHYALHDIAAFVHPGSDVWEWGSRNVDTGEEANRFRVDLRRGTYDHFGLGQPLLHGTYTAVAGPGV